MTPKTTSEALEREQFEKAQGSGFDYALTDDAWGRPVYAAPFIRAMFDGWKLGRAALHPPGDLEGGEAQFSTPGGFGCIRPSPHQPATAGAEPVWSVINELRAEAAEALAHDPAVGIRADRELADKLTDWAARLETTPAAFYEDVYAQCCEAIKPLVDAEKLPGSVVESLQTLVAALADSAKPAGEPVADGDFARMAEANGAAVDWSEYAKHGPQFPRWSDWGRFCDSVRALAAAPAPSPVLEKGEKQ